MGGTAKRIGLGVATGGTSELERAGVGPSAALGGSSGKNGIGGKGAGAPSAPDFAAAANAQAVSNHPNQTNALGATSQWTQGPDGQWTQSSSLGGPLGQAASGLEGQIAGQGPLGTGDQAREQAISGIYNQATSRLDPQYAQREESLRSQLANQGLDPGSQAFGNEMGNFGRERNDAYATAMNNAIQGGTAAQQATFGENLQSQMAPYSQLSALQGLSGQSANPGATQLLPAAMAQYQGAQNQYGANQAGKNSMMSGAASLAPLALKKGV